MRISKPYLYLALLSLSVLLFPASVLAQTVITGLSVNVAGDDTVTVNNSGTSAFPGSVGVPAGTYPYKNGWSHSSGAIQWTDTNNNNVLRLDGTGMIVQISNGVANNNGSKSGSVQLAGDTTLGAALRAAHGVGDNIPFSSNIASSSVDFLVSGTVTIAAPPYDVDLSVTKDNGTMTSVPGTQTVYTIVAANAGPDDDPSVSLTDTFPAALTCTYTSVAAGGATGNTAAGAGDLNESLSLPVGASVTYTVTCDIDSAASGDLSNSAVISSPGIDADPDNNLAADVDVLTPEIDLVITKADDLDPATAGADIIVYSVIVNNLGPSDMTGGEFSDSLTFPAGSDALDFSLNSAGATVGTVIGTPATGFSWTGVDIPAGGDATMTILLFVESSATEGTLTNSVTFDGAAGHTNIGQTDSQEPTIIQRVAVLELIKIASDSEVTAGDWEDLSFDISVTNLGPSDVDGLVLQDTLAVSGASDAVVTCDNGSGGSGVDPWVVGDLIDGASDNMTITCLVPLIAQEGDIIANEIAFFESTGGEEVTAVPADDAAVIVWAESVWDVAKLYQGDPGPPVFYELICTSGSADGLGTVPSGVTDSQATLRRYDVGTECTVVEAVPDGYYELVDLRTDGCDVNPVDEFGGYSCAITNAITNARFNVTKDFSDDLVDDVVITLTCNTGLPLTQSLEISSDPADPGVTFVVTNFLDGTMDCSVTEAGSPSGYTVDASDCVWEDVSAGDSPFSCVVTNTAQDATFTAFKEWIIVNDGGDAVETETYVEIQCDSLITSSTGNIYDCGEGYWCAWDYLDDGEALSVDVSTLTGPAYCSAREIITQSGVESEDDCFGRYLTAGSSDSCTFVNTVFFEAIPTLSQYGLALMALLMLGIGMVGFRRFA